MAASDDAMDSTDPNARADAVIAAARQGQIRRLLMLLDDDAAPDRVLSYPEVLTRLRALLAEELVRASKERDACR